MKVLSIEDGQRHFKAVCEQAIAGEVIRFRLDDGSLLELAPVAALPSSISPQQLAESYEDSDWAVFENHCGKASD